MSEGYFTREIQYLKTKYLLIAVAVLAMITWHGCGTNSRVNKMEMWRTVFPGSTQLRKIELIDQDTQKARLYAVESTQGIVGYMATNETVSRSGPFKIIVLTGTDRAIKEARTIAYPHLFGRAIQSPKFTSQFIGKSAAAPISIGDDIDAISGATLSSKAMTKGVRETIAIIEQHLEG